jgi:alkaline phosphatase D
MEIRIGLAMAAMAALALAPLAGPAGAADAGAPRAWIRSGPMLGYAEIQAVAVWLQTRDPRRVQLRYWPAEKPAAARLSAEVATARENDHIARFQLEGLQFGTRYEYEVYLDGLRVAFDYPTRFQTQVMWRWRSDPPAFRFAIGSCAYTNDPPFDRPGTPYGSDHEIFTAIAQQQPDLMLWLGDNVYYREADWLTEGGMRNRWATHRELPSLQPLLASTHHYGIWDDHDYGPNDSDRTFRGRATALEVFQDYWLNPSFGTLETPGVFGRFEWGDVEFFLLDDRFHRTPDAWPAGRDKRMWGEEQFRWLKESLRSSLATFKIVANGSQMLQPKPYDEELGCFAEKQELLDFLKQEQISGVVLLSGDIHHTELMRLPRPDAYPLFEFTSSPLTAGGRRDHIYDENALRVPGTWVTGGVHNFGLIEVRGSRGNRELLLKALDKTGQVLWQQAISEDDLMSPAQRLEKARRAAPK